MATLGNKILNLIQGNDDSISFRMKGVRMLAFFLPWLYVFIFFSGSLFYTVETQHLPFAFIALVTLIGSFILIRFFLSHKTSIIVLLLIVSLLTISSFLVYTEANGVKLIIYLFIVSIFHLFSPVRLTRFIDTVTFISVIIIVSLTILTSKNSDFFTRENGNIYYSLGIIISLLIFFIFVRFYFKTLQNLVNNIKSLNDNLEDYKLNLEKKNKELLEEKEKNSQELKMRSNFLSIMSHEIRTPLNAIVGYSEFIKDLDAPESEIRDSVKSIYFSSQHLLLLVNDILDFSRLDEKKLSLVNKSFNFKRSLNLIYSLYAKTAKESNIDLKFNIDSKLENSNYIGDETRINQVLINLLSNAIKFTDEGSVTLSCKIAKSEDSQTTFDISVEDTGVGIDKKDHKQVFERFKQIDSGVSRKYQGSGLGLSISKNIVELFGSELKLESEVGKGSRFSFQLILKKGQEENNLKDEDKFIKVLKGVNVLVADDNVINRKMISKLLGKWGVNTVEVDDGDKAVEFLTKNDCDIVLMDIHMPRLNGFDATRQIRNLKRDYISNIPVLALTADLEENTLEEISRSSINDYLSKPFDTEQLKRKLIKFVLLNLQKKNK